MNRSDVASALVGLLLLLGVLGSVTYLAHAKVIDGAAATAILTSVVTIGGTGVAVHSGVKAGAAAANSKK